MASTGQLISVFNAKGKNKPPGINIATPNKPHTINTGSIIQAIHRHTKSQIKHVLGTQKQPCRNIKISRIAHHAFL